MPALRVGVFGAGAIGVFVGGRLASAGCDVTLVGRPRVLEPIAKAGLVIEDLESATRTVPAGQLRCATDAAALSAVDLVLVTTKAGGTREAARAIAVHAPPHVPVVSIQNGVDGPATLRQVLGPHRGYGGMIAYNVVFREPTRLRRATSGPLVIERAHGAIGELVAWLRAAGLETIDAPDIQRVLWSKLLFNLNNALNALSGLPLRAQLRDRGYRRLMATMMHEGIAVMRARGMRPMRFGTMYPPLAASLLPVPDFVFERVAAAMLAIDPEARSSMAEDLAQRRPTEIDALNGTVVRYGAQHGVKTPMNARVVALVREAEAKGEGSPRLSSDRIAR
jgi:2-dehydropantoate 2-reductase